MPKQRRRSDAQHAAMMAKLRKMGILKPVELNKRPFTSADIKYRNIPRVEGPWTPAGQDLVRRIPIKAETPAAKRFQKHVESAWSKLPRHHVKEVIDKGALKEVILLDKKPILQRFKTQPWELTFGDVVGLGSTKGLYLPQGKNANKIYFYTHRLKQKPEGKLKKKLRSILGERIIEKPRRMDPKLVATHEFAHALDFAGQDRKIAEKSNAKSFIQSIKYNLKHKNQLRTLSERQRKHRLFTQLEDDNLRARKIWPTEYGQPGFSGPYEAFAENYALHSNPLGRALLKETRPKESEFMHRLFTKRLSSFNKVRRVKNNATRQKR